MRVRIILSAAVAVVGSASAVSVVSAAPAPGERMSILYVLSGELRDLVDPSGPGTPIGGDRGAVRQDKGIGGMMDPAGRDAQFRMWKLNHRELERLSAPAMVAAIKRASDSPPAGWGNSTGLVGIDELGRPFSDGPPVNGRARAPQPGSLGVRFSAAMRTLSTMRHPRGGTYADRVHIYVAPAMSTAIASGRGPLRNLGRDGRAHWATWQGVTPGLARAGGVWLQMYHGVGGRAQAWSASLWRSVPSSFVAHGARHGLRANRVHMLIAGVPSAPAGSRGCAGPMQCQWALARATPAGRSMLANGPGAYRLGAQATAWRAEFNRQFPD